MPRSHAIGVRLATALLALVTGACSAVEAPPPRSPSGGSLVAAARSAGLEAEDPAALTPEIEAEVAAQIGTGGDPHERLSTLASYLLGGPRPFEYSPGGPRTALGAFRERRGDCLAFAFLLTKLARSAHVPAYFIHVSEARSYYERGGSFFLSTHLAVGLGSGPSATVLDFARKSDDWSVAVHEAIDDEEAVALYLNNVAVDWMLEGDDARAEKLLRLLVTREPRLSEPWSNLGAALLRQGRPHEALVALRGAMERFPTYEPLYANGLQAARRAGDEGAAAAIEREGREHAAEDPFFLFGQGLGDYDARRFGLAAERFERASRAEPDSAVLLAWLARARFAGGRDAAGRKALERLEELAPASPLTRALRAEHPRAVRDEP